MNGVESNCTAGRLRVGLVKPAELNIAHSVACFLLPTDRQTDKTLLQTDMQTGLQMEHRTIVLTEKWLDYCRSNTIVT